MEGRDNEVSSFRESEYRRDGLLIAHFSYDEDIRIFSRGISDRLVEARYMFSDLFLVYEAFIIFDDVFDRIFDGDDMPVVVLIEIVHHRHQGCRLTTSCPSGDEDESTILMQVFEEILSESDSYRRGEIFFYRTDSDTDSFIIFRDICSKSGSLMCIDKRDPCRRILDLLSVDKRIHESHDLEEIIQSDLTK